MQAIRDAEHTTLPGNRVENAGIAVRDVFAEHADAFVACHLLAQTMVDRVTERDRVAVGGRIGWNFGDRRGSRDLLDRGPRRGLRFGEHFARRVGDQLNGLGTHGFELFLGQRAGVHQRLLEETNGVVLRLVA